MRTLNFTVPIRGQQQGSMKPVGRGKFTQLVSMNKNLKPFRIEVARHAVAEVERRLWDRTPFKRHYPVSCEISFVFVRPKSVKEEYRPFPVVAPDLDKLARAVFDSLTRSVWHDDAQCVQLTCLKLYGPSESVQITVSDWEG